MSKHTALNTLWRKVKSFVGDCWWAVCVTDDREAVRSGCKKVFMLIEIAPYGVFDGNGVAQTNCADVPDIDLCDLDQNSGVNKIRHNGVSYVDGKAVGFCFQIAAKDFFLGDSEGLEAFLENPGGFDHFIFFGDNRADESKALAKDTDGGEQHTNPYVRLSLLPVFYPKEGQPGGGEVAGGCFRKASECVKNFFKHKDNLS